MGDCLGTPGADDSSLFINAAWRHVDSFEPGPLLWHLHSAGVHLQQSNSKQNKQSWKQNEIKLVGFLLCNKIGISPWLIGSLRCTKASLVNALFYRRAFDTPVVHIDSPWPSLLATTTDKSPKSALSDIGCSLQHGGTLVEISITASLPSVLIFLPGKLCWGSFSWTKFKIGMCSS